MEYPIDSNQFFYDTSIVDYQPHYILRFDEIEADNIIITKHNFEFQLQSNNTILLFNDIECSDKLIDFDKFIGFVTPKVDDIGIYGKIEFTATFYYELYQKCIHSIMFTPVGNWIFNFDINTYEEYSMYGLNMTLKNEFR